MYHSVKYIAYYKFIYLFVSFGKPKSQTYGVCIFLSKCQANPKHGKIPFSIRAMCSNNAMQSNSIIFHQTEGRLVVLHTLSHFKTHRFIAPPTFYKN